MAELKTFQRRSVGDRFSFRWMRYVGAVARLSRRAQRRNESPPSQSGYRTGRIRLLNRVILGRPKGVPPVNFIPQFFFERGLVPAPLVTSSNRYLRSVLAEITSVYADIPPELNARTR